jgi:hypothetical protein
MAALWLFVVITGLCAAVAIHRAAFAKRVENPQIKVMVCVWTTLSVATLLALAAGYTGSQAGLWPIYFLQAQLFAVVCCSMCALLSFLRLRNSPK